MLDDGCGHTQDHHHGDAPFDQARCGHVPTTTEGKLFQAFLRLSRLEWHDRLIAGCTASEVRVLLCLRHNVNPAAQDMKVSQISRQLHVTSPAVTQLLKGLEVKGMVSRQDDTTDRRMVNFRLTARGEAVTTQAIEMFTSSMRGLMDHLGAAQSARLAELLAQTFDYFSQRSVNANVTACEENASR